jgi:GAF domain-containing protein
MLSNYIFIVEDTLADPRFADNPSVLGKPFVRFYAGIALRDKATHQPVAVFCIKDTKPRKLTEKEITLLFDLAAEAEKELNTPK